MVRRELSHWLLNISLNGRHSITLQTKRYNDLDPLGTERFYSICPVHGDPIYTIAYLKHELIRITYTPYVIPSDNRFILNRCSDDGDISSTDFTSTSTVGLKTRYYAQFYVFKFYDSSNVFFKCSVLVCPSDGSANCAVSSVSCFILQLSLVTRKPDFCICENTQISCAVTAQRISAFVFTTWIVQSHYYLNPKFQASSHLLFLDSPVCIRPGRKPRRPVFSKRGSIKLVQIEMYWSLLQTIIVWNSKEVQQSDSSLLEAQTVRTYLFIAEPSTGTSPFFLEYVIPPCIRLPNRRVREGV